MPMHAPPHVLRLFDCLTEQLAVYREALPFYEVLRRHAIGMDPLNPGSYNFNTRLTPSPLIIYYTPLLHPGRS